MLPCSDIILNSDLATLYLCGSWLLGSGAVSPARTLLSYKSCIVQSDRGLQDNQSSSSPIHMFVCGYPGDPDGDVELRDWPKNSYQKGTTRYIGGEAACKNLSSIQSDTNTERYPALVMYGEHPICFCLAYDWTEEARILNPITVPFEIAVASKVSRALAQCRYDGVLGLNLAE